MKDVMILSLIIIVVCLMLFLHWGKKQEAKAMELSEQDERDGNVIFENKRKQMASQDVTVQDMVRMDLYRD
ncbi:MAG: hypothetical protein MR543_05840 [Robinsoniella sp.]|nr:hypothetical protein [Robinsoniella sp.]